MSSEDQKTIFVNVPAEDLERWRQKANDLGWPMKRLVTEALDAYVGPPSLVERVRTLEERLAAFETQGRKK